MLIFIQNNLDIYTVHKELKYLAQYQEKYIL